MLQGVSGANAVPQVTKVLRQWADVDAFLPIRRAKT
jgi:hypothetical protein